MDLEPDFNRRILIVDDNPAIHDDFRKILCRSNSSEKLDEDEAAIFGGPDRTGTSVGFELDSAFQGQEAFEKVRVACEQGRPYAMAFVDVRMPPGWDGVETISRVWKICPELQIVICTAYSDYSWDDMIRQIGQSDSLLLLKKPFDNVEVLQMAHSMTRKWRLNQEARDHMGQLNRIVQERTIELREANDGLVRMNRNLESAVERANKHAREAEAAERSKDALLSDLARELRGSISATVRLTRHLIETPLGDQQRHHVDGIRLHCESLIDFASKVLTLSKPASRPADLGESEFDIRELIGQVLQLEQPAATSRGISISVSYTSPAPGWLVGDSIRLRHALSNLVETSVQRAVGSKVEIEVQTESPAADQTAIRIVVREPVPVLPDAVLEPASQGAEGGTSAEEAPALLITGRLVEALGGQLGCQQLSGQRTALWLTATFRHGRPAQAAAA